ncbi:hypothetical protein PR048_007992 [Dryococelus australis]|uniref:Uncharacterized protein n=1 Tax=Dryococelus australis TaxID=614101 RepID=A0ABQ9HWN4_9NEOP|nr:hypothetical protein PR048_007992 [Dryococelus australis]
MKNKLDKYGIQLFVVCDAYSGCAVRIKVYSGKGAEEPRVMALLKRLLDSYFNKGFTVTWTAITDHQLSLTICRSARQRHNFISEESLALSKMGHKRRVDAINMSYILYNGCCALSVRAGHKNQTRCCPRLQHTQNWS